MKFCLYLIPLLLVGISSHPLLTGIIEDEVIYSSAAQSWAEGVGFQVSVLPGEPPLTKYPPLYSLLLGVAMKLAALVSPALILWAYVFVQLSLTGLLCWLFTRWAKILGIPLSVQIAFAAAFFGNYHTLMLFAAPMSEALFMALGAAALFAFLPEQIAREEGRRTRLIGGAICSGLALLARSVGVGLIAGLGAFLLWKRKFRAVGVLAICFLLALGINQLFKSSAQIAPDGVPQGHLSGYYTTYQFVLAPYSHAWESGGIGGLIRRIGANVAANARNGLASLGNVFFPLHDDSLSVPAGSGGWGHLPAGLVILGGACYGLTRKPCGTMLLCVLVATLGILLVWTWPLTGRFWIPLFPILLLGIFFALRRFDRIGTWIFCAICAGSCLLNFPFVVERIISARFPADWAEAARRPEEPLAVREYAAHWGWLQKQSAQEPGLVILGGLNTLQKAAHFGVQGLWLDTFQHPVVFLDTYIGLTPPAHFMEQAPAQFARALEQFARAQPQKPVYIVSDFVLGPRQKAMLEQFARERPEAVERVFVSEGGNVVIYRLESGGP